MNTMFTVEESNLISIFTEEGVAPDLRNRTKILQEISTVLERLEDDKMR